MSIHRMPGHIAAAMCLSLTLSFPSWAAADDGGEEAANSQSQKPAAKESRSDKSQQDSGKQDVNDKSCELERRLRGLEDEKAAWEEVTRSIIRYALSKVGAKLNEAVKFGGGIEMSGGRTRTFSGQHEGILQLMRSGRRSTAKLQATRVIPMFSQIGITKRGPSSSYTQESRSSSAFQEQLMNIHRTAEPIAAAMCLSLTLSFPSWAAVDDGGEEGASSQSQKPAAKESRSDKSQQDSGKQEVNDKLEELEKRVRELEVEKAAREEATRSIIRDAMSKIGAKINEAVKFGGGIEMIGGRTRTFSGQHEGILQLQTAQVDFEIDVNPWTVGTLLLEYDDGEDFIFQATSGFEVPVDRINLDTAFFTVGDPLRFPPFLTFGRMYLPFGISTGHPVTDVLTVENPLTIDAFEMRKTAVGLGLGFPTPAPTPATPPVTPPPVRPLVIAPRFRTLMKRLGYHPPPKQPQARIPITPPPTPPLFNLGVYSYFGSAYKKTSAGGYKPLRHIDATAGLRARGHCGRPYDKLQGSHLCPWAIDADIDFNSSIFDSRFLEKEYLSFFNQIGFVPGVAASVKSTFGSTSLVGEWNGAISPAVFRDDAGKRLSLRPAAWQISAAYQFDWNPWVTEIGAQGTFIAVSYSQSRDLAGVTRVFEGSSSRVGSVPRKRLNLNWSEWILDNIKFSVEFSRNQDYPKSQGGTGRSGNSILFQLTAVW